MPNKPKHSNPNYRESPVLGDAAVTRFHKVSCGTWLFMRDFLKSLLVKRVAGRKSVYVALSDDEWWEIYSFIEQMDYSYSHPRSDSFLQRLQSQNLEF